MDDYYWATWNAPTDFKVGEAVRYLHKKNLQITAWHKVSDDRKNEEKKIITQLRSDGIRLLNDLGGYGYKIADQEQQRLKVQKFMDEITASN